MSVCPARGALSRCFVIKQLAARTKDPQMQYNCQRANTMGCILVVDDDSTCRNSIKKTLERDGYEVHDAHDVDGAFEALKEHAFDLIVCDYRMPGKSGLDLLSKLRE